MTTTKSQLRFLMMNPDTTDLHHPKPYRKGIGESKMGKRGYVYVLANSAMPGLVIVGKTQRSPYDRAQELWSSTGTPTPFIVVYEQLFQDCDAAEEYVHTVLQHKGTRESNSRDVFRASPKDAIEVVIRAPGRASISSDEYPSNSDAEELIADARPNDLDTFKVKDAPDSYLWSRILDKADNARIGWGDTIQDFDEAMELYIQAAKLGCPIAYKRIGEMYQYGHSVSKSKSKALEFYKKGAREGDYYCFLRMAILFVQTGKQESSEKALKLLFKAREERFNTLIESKESFCREICIYISACLIKHIVPPQFIVRKATPFKKEMVEFSARMKEKSIEQGNTIMTDNYNAMVEWIENSL